MAQLRKVLLPLVAVAAVVGLLFWLSQTGERVSESQVRVVAVAPGAAPGTWLVPADAVAEAAGGAKPYVARLVHLRAQRLPVDVAGQGAGGQVVVLSRGLAPGDLLVAKPAALAPGAAVEPVGGISDERQVALVIEAGMNAVAQRNLPESVRYISPGYRDQWGYNIPLLRQFLKRAYKEFDAPRFELAAPPQITVSGRHAEATADLRLSASYLGRRNYLLGDAAAPNRVVLRFDKAAYGWKLASMSGLRPLGFEERSFRLLGGEVGVPLTDDERREKDQFCMRCRERMRSRFGGVTPPAGSAPTK